MLFYIRANSTGDGENMDLFVIADTAPEAARHWADYYEDWDQQPTVLVYSLPAIKALGPNGPINWDTFAPVIVPVPEMAEED